MDEKDITKQDLFETWLIKGHKVSLSDTVIWFNDLHSSRLSLHGFNQHRSRFVFAEYSSVLMTSESVVE